MAHFIRVGKNKSVDLDNLSAATKNQLIRQGVEQALNDCADTSEQDIMIDAIESNIAVNLNELSVMSEVLTDDNAEIVRMFQELYPEYVEPILKRYPAPDHPRYVSNTLVQLIILQRFTKCTLTVRMNVKEAIKEKNKRNAIAAGLDAVMAQF